MIVYFVVPTISLVRLGLPVAVAAFVVVGLLLFLSTVQEEISLKLVTTWVTPVPDTLTFFLAGSSLFSFVNDLKSLKKINAVSLFVGVFARFLFFN